MSPVALEPPPEPPEPPHASADPAAGPSVPDRKTRDAGLILPLAGMVALMPPAGQIMAVEGTVLGLPIVVAYVFAVWALLIWIAWRLSRRLGAAHEGRDAPL